jgi:hypothetical protein
MITIECRPGQRKQKPGLLSSPNHWKMKCSHWQSAEDFYCSVLNSTWRSHGGAKKNCVRCLVTCYLFRLISFTNFNAQFLYLLTICMLHYIPRHVSSVNVPIFRRTNCIITAPGIVTLCKWLYSMPDESRLLPIRHRANTRDEHPCPQRDSK